MKLKFGKKAAPAAIENKEHEFKALKSEILTRRSMEYKIWGVMSRNRLRLFFFTLLGVAAVLFIIAAIMSSKGSFTITLPREQMITLGLVISDEPGFARPRCEILSPPVVDMWNITRDSIPEDINMKDGNNSTADYLAKTFYLKNMGDKDLEYTLALDLNEVFNNVDEALRIKLYINDVPDIYAKRKSDRSGKPEPGTLPFTGSARIIMLDPREIAVNQVEKFTVVAWIEGEDPDCTNDLLGGFVKMTMNFSGRVSESTL